MPVSFLGPTPRSAFGDPFGIEPPPEFRGTPAFVTGKDPQFEYDDDFVRPSFGWTGRGGKKSKEGPAYLDGMPRKEFGQARFEQVFGPEEQQEAEEAFVRINNKDGGGDPNILLQAVEGAAGQPGAAGASEGVMDQMSEFMETLGEGAGMLGQVIGAPIGLAGELIKPIFGAVDNALIEPFQDLLNHPRSQARQRREDLAGLLPSAIKAKQAGLRGALEGAVARYPGLRDVLTPELMAQFLPPMEAPTTEQSWFERVTETSGEEASRRMAEMRALAEPARAGLAQGDAFLDEVLKEEPGLTTREKLLIDLAKAQAGATSASRKQALAMAGDLLATDNFEAAQKLLEAAGIEAKVPGGLSGWWNPRIEITGSVLEGSENPEVATLKRIIAERDGGQTGSLALPPPEEAAPAQGEGGSALAQLRAMESRGELPDEVSQGVRDKIVAGTVTESQAAQILARLSK